MSDNTVVVAAFTEDQAERLSGVGKRQLQHWDRTGFFVPSLACVDRRAAYSRLYSFRDLVCLKVIDALRNKGKASLPHLREVKAKLSHLGDDMWARTTLYVLNKRVIFRDPESNVRAEVVSGQAVLEIPLRVVTGDMEEAVKVLRRRDSDTVGKIERQRNIAHNRPVVAGTRIPVRSVKAFWAAGYDAAQIQQEYPSLTAEDIRAAVAYDLAA